MVFDFETLDAPDALNLLHQTRCMTYDQLQYNTSIDIDNIISPKREFPPNT
jgi:hypothetical protein